MIVTQSVHIRRPVAEVYDAFADLNRWVDVLPDTLGVEVLYFDGYNQEFTMTVRRPNGPETVRGVRYCRPPTELELVQTIPPPGLRRMKGRWTFTEDATGTTVSATRDFSVIGDESTEPAFAEKLSILLLTNLNCFKKTLEDRGEDLT